MTSAVREPLPDALRALAPSGALVVHAAGLPSSPRSAVLGFSAVPLLSMVMVMVTACVPHAQHAPWLQTLMPLGQRTLRSTWGAAPLG